MLLFDWFYGILTSLGLWQKEAKILLLGLDKFRKMKLLHKLKGEEISSTISSTPPIHKFITDLLDEVDNEIDFRILVQELVQEPPLPTQSLIHEELIIGKIFSTSAELSIGKINFKVFDLGGHQTALRVLTDYNAKVDAVVYLVEPYDMWFAESKRELDALLSDESLANIPFLILTSGKYPISDKMLLYHLGLTNLTTGKGKVNLGNTNVRPLEVFNGFRKGHRDSFEWLSQYIK